jgi:hypothetical protein
MHGAPPPPPPLLPLLPRPQFLRRVAPPSSFHASRAPKEKGARFRIMRMMRMRITRSNTWQRERPGLFSLSTAGQHRHVLFLASAMVTVILFIITIILLSAGLLAPIGGNVTRSIDGASRSVHFFWSLSICLLIITAVSSARADGNKAYGVCMCVCVCRRPVDLLLLRVAYIRTYFPERCK